MKLINKRLYTYVLYKKVKEKQTEANLSLRYHKLTLIELCERDKNKAKQKP